MSLDPPSVPASEFLTADEKRDLTGFTQAAQQERWLKNFGLPHRRDGRRIVISRIHVRLWLEGKVVISQGPNWDALNEINHRQRRGPKPLKGI
jgi:hypothetical protein